MSAVVVLIQAAKGDSGNKWLVGSGGGRKSGGNNPRGGGLGGQRRGGKQASKYPLAATKERG